MKKPFQLEHKQGLIPCLEALLFVSSVPVTVSQLASALEVSTAEIEEGLIELETKYTGSPHNHGIRLQRHRGKYQLTTAPELSTYVERYLGLEISGRMSTAALETLSIILYLQPLTRPQIDSIRGVSSDGVIRGLMRRGLIQEEGRKDTPGRPILYGTTPDLLHYLGINSIDDLPPFDYENPHHEGKSTSIETE